MKAQTILDTIGRTPHVRLQRLFGPGREVWIKQERANPAGSIKDRIALSMVEDAERRGVLKPGGTIHVEADAAKDMARRPAREEGMLVGIASGATLAAIAKKLPELASGAVVLGFNYDTGERYLSTPEFLPAE